MLILAIVGILVSLAVGGVAAYFAWRSVVLTRRGLEVQDEQLRLQKKQAAMQPDLDVEASIRRTVHDQKDGTLIVEVVNNGSVPAHDVHGWIDLDPEYFAPPSPAPQSSSLDRLASLNINRNRSWGSIFSEDSELEEDSWYQAQIYENDSVIADSARTFYIHLNIVQPGKTFVPCRVVCEEGVKFDGELEVEIPEWDPSDSEE